MTRDSICPSSGMNSRKTIWLFLVISVEITCPRFVFSQQVLSLPIPVLPEASSHNHLLPPVFDTVFNKPKWILASLVEDQGKLWTSPLRIKTKDLKFWIPVITATTFSIVYDEDIYSAIKDFQNSHDWVSDLSPVIT